MIGVVLKQPSYFLEKGRGWKASTVQSCRYPNTLHSRTPQQPQQNVSASSSKVVENRCICDPVFLNSAVLRTEACQKSHRVV